jgi:hypothetical protein
LFEDADPFRDDFFADAVAGDDGNTIGFGHVALTTNEDWRGRYTRTCAVCATPSKSWVKGAGLRSNRCAAARDHRAMVDPASAWRGIIGHRWRVLSADTTRRLF